MAAHVMYLSVLAAWHLRWALAAMRSAYGHGGHGVADGVEEGHAGDHQGAGLQAGQQHVDAPEQLRGLADARRQALGEGCDAQVVAMN